MVASARPSSELLTRAEAADFLGIQPQTLAAWASAGRYGLPMLKVGRSVRYKKSAIEAWLASRTATHTGEVATAE